MDPKFDLFVERFPRIHNFQGSKDEPEDCFQCHQTVRGAS